MGAPEQDGAPPKRGRGRPRVDIDPDAVADTVAELFVEGGIDAVTMTRTAERLSVSRATLYRSVPTKEDLIGILFERSTRELTESAHDVLERDTDPRRRLEQLIRLQVDAAIRMRDYMPVFFGGGDLPQDVYARWHGWSRRFEQLWVDVVTEAMHRGDLQESDPVVATRLILGMCLWVCRWYRPGGRYTAEAIADSAIHLLWAGGAGELVGAAEPPPRRQRRG